jgi:hypothetical protein
MSANSAVTVLRTPSSASGELLSGATRTLEADPCDDEVTAAAPAPFVSGAPRLPQKSDVGGFSALHTSRAGAVNPIGQSKRGVQESPNWQRAFPVGYLIHALFRP